MTLRTTHKYFIPVITGLLAFLTAMSPFAIDTYLSAMPTMADYFGVKINLVEITLTLYFLGFATGNFIGGPLSDSFGRKRIALFGVLLYSISALIIPFSPNIELIWVLRFTQAFGGGFASVTTMVFVRDWFEGRQVARLATIISMIMMLAPLFAPLIGGALLQIFNWQAIFYFMVFYSIILFVVFFLVMPESREKKLLTKKISLHQFVGKYITFFSNSNAVYMLLAISSAMAGMFTFLVGSSFMYIEYFGVDEAMFPVLFASNIVLNVIFSFWNTKLLKKYNPENMITLGFFLQFFAGLVLCGHILFSSTPELWLVFVCIVIYIGSLGLIFGNGTAVILNMLPEISGSANAMIGVSRFFFSFVTGFVLALFHTGDLIPIALIMFFCTAIASVYFIIFKIKVNNGL